MALSLFFKCQSTCLDNAHSVLWKHLREKGHRISFRINGRYRDYHLTVGG